MRTGKDGLLKPDSFSEKRVHGFPPGVSVMLVMFNRMHNYIATELALINESGRFTKPADRLKKSEAAAAWKKYDNDLFQTARLINGGLYVNIILKDYVRTILALNRTASEWDLDPRIQEGKSLLGAGAPQATGNQVSAEFNLIYRWHSALSQRDEKWTEDKYAELFPGQDPADVTLMELRKGLGHFEAAIPDDPAARGLDKLVRQGDGKFNDEQLMNILADGVDDVAGSFGANRVPKILRSVEMLGIIQARSWNLASLNEFRSFFGLTKHKTFEDINPEKGVAEKLRNLYDHPDFVELYPGLVAEQGKPPMSPGSGICLNYTTSRAILSDAVALVRGDRFYTVDYTPKSLTNWGYNEVDYDLSVDQGQVMYKLFLRAFPNNIKPNSIYAHFPFVVPAENRKILTELGTADNYDWGRPSPIPQPVVIHTYEAATAILADKVNYKVTWGATIEFLMKQPGKSYGVDFCLSGDEPANLQSRTMIIKALYPKVWESEVRDFHIQITNKLLKQKSYKLGKANQVDIVRDVGNLACAHFAANVFSFPLKTDEHPRGIFTEDQLYLIMAAIFACIFYDADPAKSFPLRQVSQQMAQQLGQLCLLNVESVGATGLIADIIARLHNGKTALSDYGVHMIQRLLESGQSIKDVVWTHLLPTAGGMVANQAQLFAQTLDFYLDEENDEYLKDIHRLSKLDTPEADDLILR